MVYSKYKKFTKYSINTKYKKYLINTKYKNNLNNKNNIRNILIFFTHLLFTFFSEIVASPSTTISSSHKIVYNGSTRVLLAKEFKLKSPKKKSFETEFYKLTMFARQFAQGEAIYLELIPNKNITFREDPKIFFNKINLNIIKKLWGYQSFIGFATDEKIGKQDLKVYIKTAPNLRSSSQNQNFIHNFDIAKTNFPVTYEKLKIADADVKSKKEISALYKKVNFFKKIKKAALSRFNKILYLTSSLSHPRDYHFITSPFWSSRHILRYKTVNGKMKELEPLVRYHGGLDLRARLGEYIYALADGVVAISMRMYYEGNFILIDHGYGIFSGYMHLSEIKIKKGAKVQAGQFLGKSGATGMVTGAHLHIFLLINKVSVDPLSLLLLPIRE